MKNNTSKVAKASPMVIRKSQRGMSLVQAMLVLVIGGIVLGAALNQYQSAERNANVQKNTADIMEIVANAKTNYGQYGYAGLTTPIAVGSGVIPTRLQATTTTATVQEWGGTVTLVDNNATTTGTALLAITAVPQAICTQLVNSTHSAARQVNVNAVAVKPLDGAVNVATLNTNCVAGASTTVTWTIGR
jgi:Tfp pilus assembly protein PilE